MYKKIKKDIKKRILVENVWKERIEMKSIKEDIRESICTRNKAFCNINSGIKVYSTQLRNRCVETGNPRGIIRWFRRSGLKTREMAIIGMLPGVYKKSW